MEAATCFRDRRIRADPQCERSHGNDCKHGTFAQIAERVANLVEDHDY